MADKLALLEVAMTALELSFYPDVKQVVIDSFHAVGFNLDVVGRKRVIQQIVEQLQVIYGDVNIAVWNMHLNEDHQFDPQNLLVSGAVAMGKGGGFRLAAFTGSGWIRNNGAGGFDNWRCAGNETQEGNLIKFAPVATEAVVPSPNPEPSLLTTQPAQGGTTSYTVKAGDSLWNISQALGTTIEEIKARNGLTSDLIQPGQVLIVNSAEQSTSTPASTQPAQTGATSYTVKAGDSLWDISQVLWTTVDELKAQNGLTSDLIQPGQVLTVDSAGQPTSTPPPTPPTQTGATSYMVKAGDNLWDISQALGTTVDDIKVQNGLTSDLIQPGQVLIVNSAGQSVPTNSTQPAQEVGDSYTVKAGDSLWDISQALGTTVDDIKAQNGLTSDLIQPGQVLIVNSAGQSVPTHSTQPAQGVGNSYTVKAGDSLWSISQALGTTVDKLKARNGLTSDLIQPGQVLIVH